MGKFLGRAVAVSVGVVLGMVIVAGLGPWRHASPRRDPAPTPPAPIKGEPAPDTRV